jgi:hypothetical protein
VARKAITYKVDKEEARIAALRRDSIRVKVGRGNFRDVKVGDTVTRIISETIPMEMKVTYADDNEIRCGDWVFDRDTGMEIDDDLFWGPKYDTTGSRLVAA